MMEDQNPSAQPFASASNSTNPDDEYVAHPTPRDNDSAIHSIFGAWDPEKNEVRLSNVAAKRAEIAQQIKDSVRNPDSLLYQATLAAITAIFFDERLAQQVDGRILELKHSYFSTVPNAATHQKAVLRYLREQSASVIQESIILYADKIIGTAGQPLSFIDISVIDHTVEGPHVVIEPMVVDEVLTRHDAMPHIRICWNEASHHFQRVESLTWSGKTIKLINHDSYPTPNNGDCAFHAIFGDWDPQAGEVRLTDVAEKRTEIAQLVTSSYQKQESSLFEHVLAGIAAIFLNEPMAIHVGAPFPDIRERYRLFVAQEHEAAISIIAYLRLLLNESPGIIQAAVVQYADKIIGTAGQWLNTTDIHVVAAAIEKNIFVKNLAPNESITLNETQILPGSIRISSYEGNNHFQRVESLAWTGKVMFLEPSSRIVRHSLPSEMSDTDKALLEIIKKLLLNSEVLTPQKLASHENFNTGLPNAILVAGPPGAGKSALCSILLGFSIINIKDENTGSDSIHVYPLDDAQPVTKDNLPYISTKPGDGTQYPKPYLKSLPNGQQRAIIDSPGLNHQSLYNPLAWRVAQAFATQILISASHYTNAECKQAQGLKAAIVVLPFDHWKPSSERGGKIFEIAQWVNDVFGSCSIMSGSIQFVITKEMPVGTHLKSVLRDFENHLDALILCYNEQLYGKDANSDLLSEKKWHKIKKETPDDYQKMLADPYYKDLLYVAMEKEQCGISKPAEQAAASKKQERPQSLWAQEYKRQRRNLDLLLFLKAQLKKTPDESCLHFFPLHTFEEDFSKTPLDEAYITSLKQRPAFQQLKQQQGLFYQQLHARLSQSNGIPIRDVDIFHSEHNLERREVVDSAARFFSATLENFSNVISLQTENRQGRLLSQDLQSLEQRYLLEFFIPWMIIQPTPRNSVEEQLTNLYDKMVQEIKFLENCLQHYQTIFDMLSRNFRFYSADTLFPCINDGSLSDVKVIEQKVTGSLRKHPGRFSLDYEPLEDDQLAEVEAECNGRDYSSQLRKNIQTRMSRFRSSGHWEKEFNLSDSDNAGVSFSEEDSWRVAIFFKKPRRAFPEYKTIYAQLRTIIIDGITAQKRIMQRLGLAENISSFDKEYLDLLMARIDALQLFLDDYFNAELTSCRVVQSSRMRDRPSSIRSNTEFGPYPLSFLRNLPVKTESGDGKEDFPTEHMIVQSEGNAKVYPPEWQPDGLRIRYRRNFIGGSQPVGIKIAIKRCELPPIRLNAQATFEEACKFAHLITQYDGIKTTLAYWTSQLHNYLHALKCHPETLTNGQPCQSPGYIRRPIINGYLFDIPETEISSTLNTSLCLIVHLLTPVLRVFLTKQKFLQSVREKKVLAEEQVRTLDANEPNAIDNILNNELLCTALLRLLIDFKLRGGYRHPAIVYAFAFLRKEFEIHLWRLDDDGKKLIPHGQEEYYDYSSYSPSSDAASTQRFDLLFADSCYAQLFFPEGTPVETTAIPIVLRTRGKASCAGKTDTGLSLTQSSVLKGEKYIYPSEQIYPQEIVANLKAYISAIDATQSRAVEMRSPELPTIRTDFSISEQIPIVTLLITLFPTLRYTDLGLLGAPIHIEKLMAVCPAAGDMLRRVNQYFHISDSALPTAPATSVFDDSETKVPEISEADIVIKHSGAPLGEGSTGVVRLAIYQKKQVAVKFIQPQLAELMSKEMVAEIKNEVNAMAQFRYNPNIVQILGITNINIQIMGSNSIFTSPCIVMEYMEQGSLHDVLDPRKNLAPIAATAILQYAHDIASALLFFHASQFIHRDLKPRNIMMSEGRAKIGDWGSARLQKMTQTNTDRNRGTLEWIAPEIHDFQSGTPYKSSADIYSVAMIFLVMLLHRTDPYDATYFQNISAKETFLISVISGLRPDLPDEQPTPPVITDLPPTTYKNFANLIRMCWDKEPWRRPNAAKLLDILERIETPEMRM